MSYQGGRERERERESNREREQRQRGRERYWRGWVRGPLLRLLTAQFPNLWLGALTPTGARVWPLGEFHSNFIPVLMSALFVTNKLLLNFLLYSEKKTLTHILPEGGI